MTEDNNHFYFELNLIVFYLLEYKVRGIRRSETEVKLDSTPDPYAKIP